MNCFTQSTLKLESDVYAQNISCPGAGAYTMKSVKGAYQYMFQFSWYRPWVLST